MPIAPTVLACYQRFDEAGLQVNARGSTKCADIVEQELQLRHNQNSTTGQAPHLTSRSSPC